MAREITLTGGRDATKAVIPGDICISVGNPNTPCTDGWSWRPLLDLARLESGHTPSRKRSDWWGGTIPWVGIRDATGNHGKVIFDTNETTNEEGIANSSARVLPTSTVCLSRTASVGYVVVLGRPMATSQDFVNWVCGEQLNPHFLKYALLVENRALQMFATGSVHQTIYFPEAKAFHICAPERHEQDRIVDVLLSLDDKIEINHKMNETLEAMARALFRDWFVDFGPTRAKMEGRPAYLSDDLWSLFPDRLDDEGKPEGWENRSVYDFANVIYGAPFSSKQFNTESRGRPLIRIRDLADHAPGVFTQEVHPKGHLILPGDIVVGMDGEFRLHVWKGEEAWLNQRVCHFEPLNGAPASFLVEALKKPLEFFERGKVGTTVIHLGKGDIDTFQLLHPGEELLRAFALATSSVLDATVRNALESRTLAQTRDLLLPRLMSGELQAVEAERAMKESA